ncbi:MAG: ArnT family glycosyltransferase [Anaerolineales bacterium]
MSARAKLHVAAYPLILLFWGISLWRLDRFPPIHEDEPWILSPGYKLAMHGVYGSDLFAGFYGMEQHYFEFMPLMSALQGVSVRLIGLGVWQMRFAPAALGTLTLALTFALARQLASASDGLVAVLLLLFWQWTPGGVLRLGSGIPLVDLSRIARYDVLAAPLGLGALSCIVRAGDSGQVRYTFLGGALAGLAGLAHIYGLVWVVILLTLAALDGQPGSVLRRAGLILSGALVVWLPWLGFAATNWGDFLGQAGLNSNRFEVLKPSFYLDNVLNEWRRYWPDRGLTPRPFGFWLLVIGVPFALVRLSLRAQRVRRAAWLLAPCLLLPLLFAFVIKAKTYSYLLSVAPLFAVLLAWGLLELLRSQRLLGRGLGLLVLALLVGQGGLGMARLLRAANRAVPPGLMFAELRQTVPPSARVIGHPEYWLALPDRDYRSLILPFYLSNPDLNREPLAFDAALEQVAPQVVLLDPAFGQMLMDCSSPTSCARTEQFWSYMRRHRARLLRELQDGSGERVKVYWLEVP